MLERIAAAGLAFEGFHLFAGSQNLRSSAIVEAQTRCYELALSWVDACPTPPRLLNLGGGFGIPYTPGDAPLDIAPVAANLATLLERASREMPDTGLALELGRYLVGEAGLYVARVIDRKESRGQIFLVVDGGMHHHLAASGNFGQVMRRNFPIAINRIGAEKETASVVGPLCTPLDLLADRAELEVADVGDLVVVFQSGAYGRSASPREFLSHPDVIEALI
jgi:diaminopimelate decarboxylase